jgi:hypothetical protein
MHLCIVDQNHQKGFVFLWALGTFLSKEKLELVLQIDFFIRVLVCYM